MTSRMRIKSIGNVNKYHKESKYYVLQKLLKLLWSLFRPVLDEERCSGAKKIMSGLTSQHEHSVMISGHYPYLSCDLGICIDNNLKPVARASATLLMGGHCDF